MEFREFTEFDDPEENDYDITSSFNSNSSINPYFEQLWDLIGILDDITEEELQEQYGISMDEYYNPTEETINKVSEKINGRHR